MGGRSPLQSALQTSPAQPGEVWRSIAQVRTPNAIGAAATRPRPARNSGGVPARSGRMRRVSDLFPAFVPSAGLVAMLIKGTVACSPREVGRPPAAQAAKPVPADPYEDLAPLGRAIGDARVVALGEPLHATGNIDAYGAHLVAFLHDRLGFTEHRRCKRGSRSKRRCGSYRRRADPTPGRPRSEPFQSALREHRGLRGTTHRPHPCAGARWSAVSHGGRLKPRTYPPRPECDTASSERDRASSVSERPAESSSTPRR
jgi:hypothetical protein